MRFILDWVIRYFVRRYESLDPVSEQEARGIVVEPKRRPAASTPGS